MAYTVKGAADMAGVSIRTLHHYDDIGLLKPAQVSPSGYRLYSDADLEHLQQILFFRELGFKLSEIREIMGRRGFDRKRALLNHRELLLQRRSRLDRLIATVDRTLKGMERGNEMTGEMFDGFQPHEYEEEARRRWGGTREYEESARRTKQYTKADWAAIQQEGQEITLGLASLMDRDPADPEVQQWVGKHHQMINDRFYTCSLQVYRGLGDLYVQDERFTANYEKVKPGLAAFMRAAMHVYCDRGEVKQG